MSPSSLYEAGTDPARELESYSVVEGPSRRIYPHLSKFALDILAIPAMSADPERTFSVTKLTVSSQRHGLSPEMLEEIQCLRNWLGHQAITVGEVVSFGEGIGLDEEEAW